jgi:CelD/BcsL family acetyltransferase involved in cellulose biosynthesis
MTTQAPSLLVLERLDGWTAQWNHLVDLSPLPSPFLRSWWLTGAGGPQPRFLLAVRENQLVGGLAVEEGHRLGLPFLRMMGAGPLAPDHLDLLAVPGQEDAVVDCLEPWLRKPGTRLIDFAGIRDGSRLTTALPTNVRREPPAVAPWTPLPADFGTYMAACPALFRRNVRKASSRLTREGATHHRSKGMEAVASLGTLRRLHDAQWGKRSSLLPAFDRFAAACRLAADFDEISVHELTVRQTVIAIVVTFEVAGRVSLYQSARLTDPRWRSATTVLLAEVIGDACARGFTEADFLRGDETYKANFATARRALVRLRAANGSAGRAAMMLETAARKVKHLADHAHAATDQH